MTTIEEAGDVLDAAYDVHFAAMCAADEAHEASCATAAAAEATYEAAVADYEAAIAEAGTP